MGERDFFHRLPASTAIREQKQRQGKLLFTVPFRGSFWKMELCLCLVFFTSTLKTSLTTTNGVPGRMGVPKPDVLSLRWEGLSLPHKLHATNQQANARNRGSAGRRRVVSEAAATSRLPALGIVGSGPSTTAPHFSLRHPS